MNDSSPGCPPAVQDGSQDVAKQQTAQPSLQRAFMDRARRAVEREHEKIPRRLGQHAVSLVAAFALPLGPLSVFADLINNGR